MSAPNDGGRAFPNEGSGDTWDGMSIRTYLAGQALAGLCASERTVRDAPQGMPRYLSPDELGQRAVAMADATLRDLGLAEDEVVIATRIDADALERLLAEGLLPMLVAAGCEVVGEMRDGQDTLRIQLAAHAREALGTGEEVTG